jgi:hypothetical protein
VKKIRHIFTGYLEIVITILITIFLFLFLFYKEEHVKKEGVITIAKVLRWEASGDSYALYIETYFRGKKYPMTLNLGCGGNCEGQYFFISIDTDSPNDYPLLHLDKKVPDCILSVEKDFNGWKDFPACNNP